MWQAPWGYPESFAIVGGLLTIGLALQLCIGSFDFYLLAAPSNIYVSVALIASSVAMGCAARHNQFAKWFSGCAHSVALIVAILLLSIIMGLTPQIAVGAESKIALGFDSMTSNWAFVILYAELIVVVGALIVKRLRHFKIKDFSFYINHIGVWLTLSASALGYADMERYIMYVNEGETEWRVYDSDTNIKELPIAIKLNDFMVEYYPQQSIIVDTQSGEVVRNPSQDIILGEKYRRMMLSPEPRSFISDVEVYSQDGETIASTIEVNKPLRVGSWMIYQYGYDNVAGAASTYSSFELIYDKWLWMVYVGIIMMMVGSVAMIVEGRKKRGGKL